VSFDVFGLMLQASPIVKLVMLGLVIMSAVSWTIIASKWLELKRAIKDGEAFLEVYHEETYEDAFEAARLLDRSPLCAMFMLGCNELGHLAKRVGASGANGDELRVVEMHLEWSAIRESHRLERGLTFLATTGSAAPFIGLFGTVVGIIQTFQSIGQAGNASLAVVGPGMAEALIATAMGLVAAIPASIFYNIYARRIDEIQASIDLFRSEFQGDLVNMMHETNSSAFKAPRG
jgi:biopolymer transport protein TolQ